MPDLGNYALEVGLAYAASLILLAGLVLQSWWRGRKMRDALRDVEQRRGRDAD